MNSPKRRFPYRSVLKLVGVFLLGVGIMALLTWQFGWFDKPPIETAKAVETVEAAPLAEEASAPQSEVILNVPSRKQEYRQSCEAASLRMALNYRGIDIPDWDILQMFGYDPKHRDMENNIWGDPNKQFVGDVRGAQDLGEGFGVYAPRVAAIAPEVGRELKALKNVTAQQLAEYIYAGNPVIIWGYYNAESKADSWKTPEGKTIPAVIKAHVRLAYGVKGPADNPTGFYVHDPLIVEDDPVLWSTEKFMDNLKKFGEATDQAVVVL